MKEVTPERIYAVHFHLYTFKKMKNIVIYCDKIQISSFLRLEWGNNWISKWNEESFVDDAIVVYLDCRGSFMNI